jgi:flagellar biosynthesis chaperone FliJ
LIPDKELKRATKQNTRNKTQPTNTALNMPSNNRGRRGAPAVNRGVAIGRAQTPVRARPVEDPILVIAQAITESQIVSNLHDTSSEHRNTIKQLKERIQDLTKQIKQKNRELSSYKGLEQKVVSLQNKIDRMETPKIQKIKPTQKDIVDFCNKECRGKKSMAEIFGEEMMNDFFEQTQRVIFEGTGLKDRGALLLFWKAMEKTGILKIFETEDQTHHILNFTKPEEVERLKKIEGQFKRFILDLHLVVPDHTKVMENGNIVSSGLVEYIKGLKAMVNAKNYGELLRQIKELGEENKKLKQQIEQDDNLFEDCQ